MADMLTELERHLPPRRRPPLRDWSATGGSHLPGVRVPLVMDDNLACHQAHASGFVCTRPPGHGGRHVGAVTNGDVVAVWSPPEVPC